jgi:hypothetical protein
VYEFLQSYYPAIRAEHMNAASDSLQVGVQVGDEARRYLLQMDADDEQLWTSLERAGGILDPCRLLQRRS